MKLLALLALLSACGMDGPEGDVDPNLAPSCAGDVTTFACPGQPAYVRTCRVTEAAVGSGDEDLRARWHGRRPRLLRRRLPALETCRELPNARTPAPPRVSLVPRVDASVKKRAVGRRGAVHEPRGRGPAPRAGRDDFVRCVIVVRGHVHHARSVPRSLVGLLGAPDGGTQRSLLLLPMAPAPLIAAALPSSTALRLRHRVTRSSRAARVRARGARALRRGWRHSPPA